MTKKTTYASKDGSFTGKTVTETNGGYSRTTNYKRTGSGFSKGWKATATTEIDPKGNSRTKTYK